MGEVNVLEIIINVERIYEVIFLKERIWSFVMIVVGVFLFYYL